MSLSSFSNSSVSVTYKKQEKEVIETKVVTSMNNLKIDQKKEEEEKQQEVISKFSFVI